MTIWTYIGGKYLPIAIHTQKKLFPDFQDRVQFIVHTCTLPAPVLEKVREKNSILYLTTYLRKCVWFLASMTCTRKFSISSSVYNYTYENSGRPCSHYILCREVVFFSALGRSNFWNCPLYREVVLSSRMVLYQRPFQCTMHIEIRS